MIGLNAHVDELDDVHRHVRRKVERRLRKDEELRPAPGRARAAARRARVPALLAAPAGRRPHGAGRDRRGRRRPSTEDLVLPDVKHDFDLVLHMLNYQRGSAGCRRSTMPLFVQPDELVHDGTERLRALPLRGRAGRRAAPADAAAARPQAAEALAAAPAARLRPRRLEVHALRRRPRHPRAPGRPGRALEDKRDAWVDPLPNLPRRPEPRGSAGRGDPRHPLAARARAQEGQDRVGRPRLRRRLLPAQELTAATRSRISSRGPASTRSTGTP